MTVLGPRKEKVRASFEHDQFVADCRSALAADNSHRLVREVVKRAVADPAAVLKALGEPSRAGLKPLYRSDELTILNIVWGPNMVLLPHDHRMWAVIGIYSGREDNIFWRRLPGHSGKLEAAGAKALCEGDAEPLGHNIIHSVINPIPRLTAAIHVYGGDFFPRNEANGIRKLSANGVLTRSSSYEGSKRRTGASATRETQLTSPQSQCLLWVIS
jgi:predicted metal-dependent enzyme (double-stranded beta helix superfamily)